MAGIYLEFLGESGREGEILRLAGRSFVVGRATDCQVRIASETVSRRHAILSLECGAWMVVDQQSRAGTFLNGERIGSAPLHPVDEVRLGPSGPRIRIVSMDPAPPIPEEGRMVSRVARPEDAGRPPASPSREEEEIPVAVPLQPRPAARPPTPPPPPARASRRVPPVLAPLGILFGAAVALGLLGADFPYEQAAAPIMWCMAAWRYVAPDSLAEPNTQLWLFRGLLAAYGLVAGFLIQRPFRRIVLLLALAGLHVLAALAL